MTISYVSRGALADGTTSVTPGLPAGATAGQLAVLQVVSGHPNDSVPSTPSGWTLVGSFSGGGGTFGPGSLLNSNPAVETDLTGWVGKQCSLALAASPSGAPFVTSSSIKVTPDGVSSFGSIDADSAYRSPVGSISAGQQYTASAWVYSPGGWSDMEMALDWFDASNTYLSTSAASSTAVSAGVWTLLSSTFTAPTSASRAGVRVRQGTTPPSGAIWYADEIILRPAGNGGPRRLTLFARELAGGDAAPTTSIPSGSAGSVIGGFVFTLSRTAGTGWRWAATFGEDATSGTGFSVPCSTAITWAPGDFAVLGYATDSSLAGPGSPGVTASGITFGTAATRVSAVIASGNGAWAAMHSAAVTAGTGSAAPTESATLTAAATGVGGVMRVREASSAVSASPQSVFPPRNLVSVTGLKADDITTVSVSRQQGTDLTAVRAASGIDTTGADVLLRVDAEQPFGVPVTYAATLTDVNGVSWTTYSGSITSTVTGDVISDAVQGTGARVFIESWDDKKRSRDATVFNVGGRLVTVGRPRSAAQATVTVSTDTDTDGDALQGVLNAATEGVILIRKQVTHPYADGYQALLDDDEKPNWQTEYRAWDLSLAEAEPWPDSLEAAGYTLQDIANNYSTLADLAAAFSTLLAIAQFDWGG